MGGNTLGVDIFKALGNVQFPDQHMFIPSSMSGCKCGLLVLQYEDIPRWERHLRQHGFPRVSVPDVQMNTGIARWSGPLYKDLLATLEYAADELKALCRHDT